MAAALGHPLQRLLLRQRQVNEAQSRRGAAQDVAVAALERRAGQHRAAVVASQLAAQPLQPAGAVGVVERHALAHLLDVRSRMEFVAFDQRQSQRLRDPLAHRGLAATRYPHHHQANLSTQCS